VTRGYWFGRVKKTKGMGYLVADTGTPDEALSQRAGIDLELFGTFSGSQRKSPGLVAHDIIGCDQPSLIAALDHRSYRHGTEPPAGRTHPGYVSLRHE